MLILEIFQSAELLICLWSLILFPLVASVTILVGISKRYVERRVREMQVRGRKEKSDN